MIEALNLAQRSNDPQCIWTKSKANKATLELTDQFYPCENCKKHGWVCMQRFADNARPLIVPYNIENMTDMASWGNPANWTVSSA